MAPRLQNGSLGKGEKRGTMSTVALVVGYGLSSSLLAIINKYAVTVFPYPGLLTAFQYLTSVICVMFLGRVKIVSHDAITWTMLRKFLPAAFVFYVAIFTNTKLLFHANVETFIVFRSSTPLFVAIADSLFMSRPWPSRMTFMSLNVILGGAIGYAFTDEQFTVKAYMWAVAYLLTITLEMVYIKHIVTNIGLSTWGLVLYNNFTSLLLSPIFLLASGEAFEIYDKANPSWLDLAVSGPVILSCLFGLLISFFGFACRKAVSATAFTVVGVTNKLLTVLINLLMWDKHASTTGILSLLVCIAGGVLYQQSTSLPRPPTPAEANPSKV